MAPLPLNRLYLAHSHSEPAFGVRPDQLFYVKVADGRRAIYRQSLASGLTQAVTTEPAPAGGVGYGGGNYCVQADILVYAGQGGRLQRVDLGTGMQRAISPVYEGVAAPAISPGGDYAAFIAEQDGACNVLLVDINGAELPVKLTRDPWYAFNPVFSPDGTRLAWMEWDAPYMPWDECRVMVARLSHSLAECRTAADVLPLTTSSLARPRVSYTSPQFSPDGRHLAYTSDESGWRSLWVTPIDSPDLHEGARRVDTGMGEIGAPDWVPGVFKLRWSAAGSGTGSGGSIFAIRQHQSRAQLLRVDWPEQTVSEIETGWTWMTGLNLGAGQLVFVAGRPTQPEELVTLDLRLGQSESVPEPGTSVHTLDAPQHGGSAFAPVPEPWDAVDRIPSAVTPQVRKQAATLSRATNGVGLVDPASLVEPAVISWTTAGDATAWGIFYAAQAPVADSGSRPLIVSVHGGPTSERGLTWDADAQYYATRGWHYLLVNNRGSSGFGRAYQDLLDGQWGVVDVEDARTGAEHLVRAGLADPERLVITGHSAGGYTTMMAVTADPDFWTAGVALSGISHMYDMKQGAHRFEVNYEGTLIGRLPHAGRLWMERSPLTHVKQVRAPVLLFHGRKDKAVPIQQSIDFAEAVRRNGGIADLVIFEDEGHSFGREANQRTIVETTDRFLDKYVLCLQR